MLPRGASMVTRGVLRRLAVPLFVAALLAYLLARSGAQPGIALVAAALVLGYAVSASGRLLLAAAGERSGRPNESFVAGLIGTCLAIYALTLLLPITAGAALGVVLAAVLAADIATARRLARPPLEWRSWVGFALCVLLTAIWCRAPAGASEVLRTQGVLPVWTDYYFHGGLISQFGDVRAVGRGSIYLADYAPSFYHFASYGAAAALVRLLDLPGLPLAVGAWLPLGFLAMLAGAHALGERLSGPAGGLAALVAVAILPDASNYALRNGWFSFHFTLFAHAGATYAIGAAFLSLVLLERWSAERSRPALLASALLAAATLLFRAHIFFLFLPAWAATAVLCSVPRERRRLTAWLLIGALSAAAAAASLGIAELSEHGFWRFHGPALAKFLEIVHTGQEPTAYTDVYAALTAIDAPAISLTVGIVLAVVAALGAFTALLPAAALLAREAGVLRPLDAACGYLAFCWLLLMLFAPVPWHGDASDLIHRPFVLLYAAAAIWTLCLALRMLDARLDAARRAWPALLAGLLLALPFLLPGAESMSKPKFAWGKHDYDTRVDPGLVPAAGYLRAHAAVGDIFAVDGLGTEYATYDVSTELCALSGLPAYLSRPHFEMIKEPPRKAEVLRRLAALQAVDAAPSYGEAMQALRALRVQWYVVTDASGPRWDPGRARAAFTAGRVSVYAAAGATALAQGPASGAPSR
jgi:hypothetical protein